MDDDTTEDTPKRNDPGIDRFGGPGIFRYRGVPIWLKPSSDFGSWRSALLILTLSVVIIAALTYLFHLAPVLVYVLLVVAATLAGLVWNQVLGHRR